MKKIIASFLLLTIGATTTFANTELPDPKIEKQFKKDFAGAEHVKWGEASGYISASFVLAGYRTQAWFTAEGELMGSMRGILYNQLPLVVARTIQNRFTSAIIYDITEVVNTDGTRYKLTIENKGRKYSISVLPDGNIDETKRIKN